MADIERSPEFKELLYRRELARLALYKVSVNILQESSLFREKALKLGPLYANYRAEFLLHAWDLAEAEADPWTGHIRLLLREQRLEAEAALFSAQSGDYRQLRDYLGKEGKYLILSTVEDPDRSIELGNRLLVLCTMMPDYAEPFKPPLPAWGDPQFAEGENPESV